MRSKIAFVIILSLIAISVIGLEYGFLNVTGRGQGQVRMFSQEFWSGVVVIPIVAAIVVFAYITLFPELSVQKQTEKINKENIVADSRLNIAGILRVLKEDEKRVVEVLIDEGGIMLQKDIRWKLKLSRVKIHRILSRLAERGIVKAEKHYNTNKITLVDWLMKDHN
jgi:predicted HTH transcriptional regulator